MTFLETEIKELGRSTWNDNQYNIVDSYLSSMLQTSCSWKKPSRWKSINTHTHTRTHTRTHTTKHTYTHMYTHAHTQLNTHTRAHAHTHTHTHTHSLTHSLTHTHHTHVSSCSQVFFEIQNQETIITPI